MQGQNGNETGSLGAIGTKECETSSIAGLFTIAKTQKQPTCPSTEEWMKKTWCMWTMDYSSATKENELMPFAATRMDLEIIILSEVSKKEKDKYMTLLICDI